MTQDETRHEDDGETPRTTPSQAVGESGDEEARRQAEDAVQHRSVEDAADEDGSTAKKQSPGLGREEQRAPHPDDGTQEPTS
ncbi:MULTISPECIES: hypothetical protein [unclassified Streptomyces]|jgi:hypothetical protein|uniref:hypothetical protein n=1 Tax=unclassified Streptomyces TaxID=2593676 RepID=UPI0036BA4130